MELTNQQALPVGQQEAWDALNDIALLQAAMPGCESITATDAGHYEVLMAAAIGPVKAKFKGKLHLENLVPPQSYDIRFEGNGGAAGHAKGVASVRLEPDGDAQTVLHYSANATVGGKIAQIGSRLVDMAAQKMAGEFFANFTQALIAKHGVPAPVQEAAPAGGGLLARLLRWFKGLFGG